MAAVPVTIHAFVYPKNKSVEPFPATIVGWANITGLEVGGGPIMPPDIQPQPPLVIWGPDDPRPGYGPPEGGPDEPPPDRPPPQVEPPHEGWNWSNAKGQWYYLYVPGKDQAQPKRPGR